MAKAKKSSVDRRRFLKGAAAGAAVLVAPVATVEAQSPQRQLPSTPDAQPQLLAQREAAGGAPVPTQNVLAKEGGAVQTPSSRIIEHPGSDFMVDVIKTLNIEYLASNPGSTFESLHESLINYGQNKMPEFLTVCHEESAVAMAHGYYKIEGKPMMALIHGDIGLQHASMAIYNAYADRVPIFMVVGNHADEAERSQGVQSLHSAQDLPSLVRDYVKWDDQPYSLGHFADSTIRAYKIAMTPPMGPVLIVAHNEVQAHPQPDPRNPPRIPRLTMTVPPQGEMGAVNEAAKMLVNAERPMIIAERAARTPNGINLITELGEVLQSPVNSLDRVHIANTHPMAGTGGPGYNPDVTLCLELSDLQNVWRAARQRNPPGKVISISSVTLNHKSNIQDFGHYADIDLDMGADAEATLPSLIEACRKLITTDRKRAIEDRGKKLAEAHHKVRLQGIESAEYGWDSSPVRLNRVCAELWPLIKDDDWSLVAQQQFLGNWPNKLWKFDKHYQYTGQWGAAGMGYNAPAAVGAALANRKYGRLSINIQCDGDLNYAPGVLWTAAHHNIPLLVIMHNNRAYHAETMFVQQQCALHNRGVDRAHIGTTITSPNIDYAKMAQAYGLFGEGPITDPNDLSAAFKRGLERVKKGEPALIDVVTQAR
jgi:thiamine pyrophosphate-dependent acetolactate synthase large subunit-like protein